MAIWAKLITFALLTVVALGQSPSTMPMLIYKPEPQYSIEERKAKGAVTVQVLVDEQGIPRDPKIVTSLDRDFDQQVIEAVKQWRFKPGMTRDGKPMSVSVMIKIFRPRTSPPVVFLPNMPIRQAK